MWIDKPERITRHKPSDFDRVIELGSGTTAQVKRDAGEFLIANYDEYTTHDS